VTTHAYFVVQIVQKPQLNINTLILDKVTFLVSGVGGGPGSVLNGLLKYLDEKN
jgi:hypothetical protein